MNRLHSLLIKISFGALLFLVGVAQAQESLRCNAKQTFCVVENKRLVVGDQVLVLNSDEEIVAHGEIADMQGESRRINITKKVARINSGAMVKTDRNGDIDSLAERYRYYHRPAKSGFGVTAGITNLNVAGRTTAYGAEAVYQQRFMWGSYWTLRGHFFTASGYARQAEYEEETEFSVTGTVVYGGLAYEFWRKQPFMLRTEAGLGLSYVGLSTNQSSAVTFASDSAPPEVEKIGSGVGVAGRIGTELGYTRMGSWMPVIGASFEQINRANGVTLSAGIMTDL